MISLLRALKGRLAQDPRTEAALRRALARLKTRGNRYAVRGRGNRITAEGVTLRNVVFDVIGDDNSITLGPGCRISDFLFKVRGSGHRLVVGRDCAFGGGALWAEDSGCVLTVGEGTTMEEAHVAVTEPGRRIEIGRGCMFAQRVVIRSGDSHSILDAASGRRLNPARDVHIGDRVWLAAGVQVLKGAVIGDDCVVGTQSVVTRGIPANSLAVGTPARVVRPGVRWDRQRVYDDASQQGQGPGEGQRAGEGQEGGGAA